MHMLIPPTVVATFALIFWYLDYYLKKSILSDAQETEAIHKDDKHNGFWSFLVIMVLLGPLYCGGADPVILVLASAGIPLIATLGLGVHHKHYSVSAVLLISAHGAGVALLFLIGGIETVQSCLDYVGSLNDSSEKLAAISICAEMSRFWFNSWMTISFAVITIFGGALASLYLLKPGDYARRPYTSPAIARKERRVLAILYSIVIIWMLVAGFMSVGVPAIRYLKESVDLKTRMTAGQS